MIQISDNELRKCSEELVNFLREKKITISLAESCTGGLIAKSITDVSGASEVFHLGVVSYSNDVKQSCLGVKEDTLNKFGAVSEQTATQMCIGIREISKSDIAVSVTGIAGPTSDNTNKPVGLVYVGVNIFGSVTVIKLNNNFDSDVRENNRKMSAICALDNAFRLTKEWCKKNE